MGTLRLIVGSEASGKSVYTHYLEAQDILQGIPTTHFEGEAPTVVITEKIRKYLGDFQPSHWNVAKINEDIPEAFFLNLLSSHNNIYIDGVATPLYIQKLGLSEFLKALKAHSEDHQDNITVSMQFSNPQIKLGISNNFSELLEHVDEVHLIHTDSFNVYNNVQVFTKDTVEAPELPTGVFQIIDGLLTKVQYFVRKDVANG